MSKQATMTLKLPADSSAALSAVAKATGETPPELAARVLIDWVGPVSDLFVTSIGKPEARQEAAARLAVVRDWQQSRRAAKAGGRTATSARDSVLQRARDLLGRPVSARTLYLWERAWVMNGVAGLVDGRRDRAEPRPSAFLQAVRSYMVSKSRRSSMTLREAYDAAKRRAAVEGWEVPHIRTVSRFMKGRQ